MTHHPEATAELFDPIDYSPPKTVSKASDDERALIAGSSLAFTVPFGSIVVPTDNVRDAASTDIAGLAASIRSVGLQQPLSVEPGPDGTFLLVSGFRRWMALTALGLAPSDPVPVHPLAASTGADDSRTARQVAENVHRADMKPMEEARAALRLRSLHGMKAADIAKHFGWGKDLVARRVVLLELPEEVHHKVDSGDWPLEAATDLARLIRDKCDSPAVKAMLEADRLASYQVNHAWDDWRKKKAARKLAADLESRGFVVVRSLSAKQVLEALPDGGKARTGPILLDASATPNDVKQLKPSKVETLRTKRKPIVNLVETWPGVVVYCIAVDDAPVQNNDPLPDWKLAELVEDEIHEAVVAEITSRFAKLGPMPETDIVKAAALLALDRVRTQEAIGTVSDLLGVAAPVPAQERQYLSGVETLAWRLTVMNCDPAELFTACRLAHAAHYESHFDETEDAADYEDGSDLVRRLRATHDAYLPAKVSHEEYSGLLDTKRAAELARLEAEA